MASRRRIWIRRVAGLGVLAGVFGAVAAIGIRSPGGAGVGDVDVRLTKQAMQGPGLSGDGWPFLTAVFQEQSARGRTWQACRGGSCGPVLSHEENFAPGLTPAGTHFRVSAPDGDPVWAQDTPTWRGRVRSVRPPTVRGRPIANDVVTPTRGEWAGGWDDDGSIVGIVACRSRAGDDCVSISDSLILAATERASARISPVYAGWYIAAIEHRVPGARDEAAMIQTFPRGVVSPYEASSPGPQVAMSALIGPVTAS